MFFIILMLAAAAFAGFTLSKSLAETNHTKKTDIIFVILMFIGLAVRIFCAGVFKGHQTDVTDFTVWSDMLFRDGIPAFYASDSFTDYPPGYMYVLWVIGFIKNTFNLSGTAELILIKMPAIAADLLISVLLYFCSKKRGSVSCCLAAALFIFNPAVILNSSVWGQVDSVMTLLVSVTVLLLSRKKTFAAYFTFALSVFVKPQAFMFAPLIMYAFWENIRPYSAEKLVKNIACIFFAAAAVFALAVPFGIGYVIPQYTGTLASYPYATVNAFNLWAALGKNWDELTNLTSVTGACFLAAVTAASFYIMHRNKNSSRYFYAGAFLCFSAFMLSVKMHERYAYPVIALMLFSFVLSGDFRHYILCVLLSLSQFFNTAYILFVYESDPSRYFKSPVIIAASVINLLIYLYFAYSADRIDSPLALPLKRSVITVCKSAERVVFSKKDLAVMAAVTAVYSVVAFSALGDRTAPQNEYVLEPEKEITAAFEQPEDIKSVRYFLGSYPLDEERILTVTLSDKNGRAVKTAVENDTEVFFWSELDMENTEAEFITISANKEVRIKEMALIGSSGEKIEISGREDFGGLFDEQELVPEQETYMNSTYFDEIYHARTGYEFIHKLPVYEWTHPPLGKIFISLGIRLFGMTPFGWRCAGVFFGIMMVPLIFIFAKLIVKKTWLAAVTAILFTFDFMHYVQTRISTIDVYVTFFIMLMYLFMFLYSSESFYDTDLKKTFVHLGLCGTSMGLAVACKWTGVYAAAGLAVIFFMTLYRRWREYRAAAEAPDGVSGGIQNSVILERFPKYTLKTLMFCCVFFVAVPIVIYMLSYIPYLAANGEGIEGIWKNQKDIFTYHSKTVVESTHAYASPWYTWPVMIRPIWYYSNSFENGLKAGISAFGNPLVWWPGIASLVFCIVLAVKDKDKTAAFLAVAYAANFLPWAAVTRTMFIYHYFPSVPFVVLMSGYSLYKLYENHKWIKGASFVYAACAVILFAAFYPVLTGTPVDAGYVKTFLCWLPKWVLI